MTKLKNMSKYFSRFMIPSISAAGFVSLHLHYKLLVISNNSLEWNFDSNKSVPKTRTTTTPLKGSNPGASNLLLYHYGELWQPVQSQPLERSRWQNL